ncbi:MAG: hypothetical protein ACRDH9_09965 [Actinomycetota bacterium]
MDPVTGLSKRQLVAVALLIPLGIAASTIATFSSERGDPVCPEGRSEGCSISEAGEPVVIGVIADLDSDTSFGEELASATRGRAILGHDLRVDLFDAGCDVREASAAARDTTDDPPDYPPAALVLVSLCSEAAVAPLQIVQDEGIPGVAYGDSAEVVTPLEEHLVIEETEFTADLTDRLTNALSEVAVRDEQRVLIPLTELREALITGGLREA